MKKIKTIGLIMISMVVVLIGCKKKQEATPATSNPTSSIPEINPLTATVNGNAYSTYKFNNAPHHIMSGKNSGAVYYFFSGNTSQFFGTGIGFNLVYGIGTYTFSSNSNNNYKAFYTGNYPNGGDTVHTFNAITGAINITQFDTIPNSISKLKATFSFTTNTSKSTSYTVTNGVIDYQGQ